MARGAIIAAGAALAAGGAAAQVAVVEGADFAVETFGYGRAGLGWTVGEGAQVCFRAPGAGAKYRLGNECEIYVEPGLRLRFGREDAARAALVGRLRIYSGPVNDFEDTIVAIEEAFVSVDDVAPDALRGADGWGGQRFYMRRDIHINDFYWWDMSGLGFGVEDVDLGPGTGALAYFVRSGPDLGEELRDSPGYHRIDARLGEIGLGGRWSLDLGADLRLAAEVDDPETAVGAMATMAVTRAETVGGETTLALQTGLGPGSTLANVSDPDAAADALSARAVAVQTFAVAEGVVGQAAALAEWRSEGPEWVSAGARPVFEIAAPVYLAVEAGVDHVWDAGGGARTLGKLTAAVEIKPTGGAFFDRPAFRAFATVGTWSDGAGDAGIAPEIDGRSGVTVGLQVEHWW